MFFKFETLFLLATLIAQVVKADHIPCVNQFGNNKLNGSCSLIDECQGAAFISSNCSQKDYTCCIQDTNSTKINKTLISKEIFLKIAGNTPRNGWIYGHFSDSLDYSGAKIDTVYKASFYLSQLLDETNYFRSIESSKPEKDIDKDIGNNGTGDGSLYRGRGAILLRGKLNYQLATNKSGLNFDFYNNPECAAFPSIAFKLAAWFWTQNAYVVKSLNPSQKESLNYFVESGSFFGFTMLTHSLTNNLQSLKQRANTNEKILNSLNYSMIRRGQGLECTFKNGNRNVSGLAVPICLADFKKPYCGCPNKYDLQSCPYGQIDKKCRNSALIKCCEEKCDTYLDLVILIDSSGSINEDNFKTLKNFIKEMIKKLPVSNEQTRISLISFNTNADILIKLNNGTSPETLEKTIDNLNNDAGGDTFTDKALKLANEEILNVTNGMRSIEKGVAKVVMVITDGASNNQSQTLIEANRIKERGINIISVGIKPAEKQELINIASTPDNQFFVESFSQIFELLSIQLLTVCYQPAQIPCSKEIDSQVDKDSYKYFKLSLLPQTKNNMSNASNNTYVDEFTFQLKILSGDSELFYSFEDPNPRSQSDYLSYNSDDSNENFIDQNFTKQEFIHKIVKSEKSTDNTKTMLYPVKNEQNEFIYFSVKGIDDANSFQVYVFEEYIENEDVQDEKKSYTTIIIAVVVAVLVVSVLIGSIVGVRRYKKKKNSKKEQEPVEFVNLSEKYLSNKF